MNIGYVLATEFLALVFAISALAKLIQPKPQQASTKTTLQRLTHWTSFPWVELFMSAMLVFPLPAAAQAVVAMLMGAVVVSGQITRLRHPENECDCFGSMTPTSQVWNSSITLFVVCAVTFIVLLGWKAPVSRMAFNPYAFLGTVVALYLVERKLRFDQLTGVGYASKVVDLSKIEYLPSTLALGNTGDIPLLVGSLSASSTPTMIVYVSSHCPACHRIFEAVVKGFGYQHRGLNVVVISNNNRLFDDTPSLATQLKQVVDPLSQLGRHLGIKVFPYALFLGANMKLQATAQGIDNVIKLLSIVLHAAAPEPAKEG